jgi:hypothetical protein
MTTITIVLTIVGLLIGGGLGAWWALRQPPKNSREPPTQP